MASIDINMDDDDRTLTLCQPCLLDDVSNDARAYCLDCVEGLCDNCMINHRKIKASRNHGVMKIDNDDSRVRVLQCLNQIFKCQIHPDAVLDSYCGTHNHYICSLCLTKSDRGCKETSDESITQLDFSHEKKMSDDIERMLTEFKPKWNVHAGQLNAKCGSIANQIKILVQKFHKEIDDLDKDLHLESERLLASDLEKVADPKTCEEIEVCQRALLKIVSFVEETRLKNKYHVLKQGIQNILGSMKKNISARRTAQIELSEVTNAPVNLGTVRVIDSEAQPGNACADNATGVDTFQSVCLTQHVNAFNTKKEGNTIFPLAMSQCTFHRKLILKEEEKKPCITSIVPLGNGVLVLADNANKMLRILNAEGEQTSSERLEYIPLSMCEDPTLKIEGVVVIFSDTNKIHCYSINANGCCRNGQLFSGHKVLDITRCDKDVALLVSSCMGYAIEKRDRLNGKRLSLINIPKKSQCRANLYDIEAETTTYPLNLLYIGNMQFVIDSNDEVHCLNERGSKIWFHKKHNFDYELKSIVGLAADDEDNVYICCEGSLNIHQVSARVYRKHRVILQNMTNLSSIAFDKSRKVLYVGFDGRDEVSCYKFA